MKRVRQIPLFRQSEVEFLFREDEDHLHDSLTDTLNNTWRVFCFSIAVSAIFLLLMQNWLGQHNQGEEIVVLATPQLIAFLVLRLVRTKIAPLARDEIKGTNEVLPVLLGGLLGICFLFLLLDLACIAVYRYFQISWAVLAAWRFAKGLGAVLIFIAAAIFCVSEHGRKALKLALRALMAFPDVFLETLLPHHFHTRRL